MTRKLDIAVSLPDVRIEASFVLEGVFTVRTRSHHPHMMCDNVIFQVSLSFVKLVAFQTFVFFVS